MTTLLINPYLSIRTYEQAVMDSSPYLHYPLDDATGTTAIDRSGNERHGTYNGAPALHSRELGKWLTADFDGSNDFVNTPTFDTTGWTGVTLECWFLLDAQLNGTGLMSEQYTGSGDRITLEMGGTPNAASGSNLSVARYNGSAWHAVASGISATLDTVYYMVGTMDASTLVGEVWLNGDMVGSGSLNSWMPDNNYWTIGRRHDTAGTPYVNGAIAQAAIYNRVITPTEISDHYMAGAT